LKIQSSEICKPFLEGNAPQLHFLKIEFQRKPCNEALMAWGLHIPPLPIPILLLFFLSFLLYPLEAVELREATLH
jgi:hypothetical protein